MAALVEPHTERRGAAVRLVDEADAGVAETEFVAELARLHDRAVEIGCGEGVAEPLLELGDNVGTGVEPHGPADCL
jgi:hypothetical protein